MTQRTKKHAVFKHNLQCRMMRNDDLAQVLQIERNTQAVPWSRLTFEESLTRSESEQDAPYRCQVLCQSDDLDDAVLGFSIVSKVLEEAHILNIAVAPAFQGQNLGHSLMNDIFIFAQANQISQLFLEVRASNTVAQSLYLKWGFEQISVRKAYYRTAEQGREDAHIYRRQLTNTVSA